jgi:hypothetical protein
MRQRIDRICLRHGPSSLSSQAWVNDLCGKTLGAAALGGYLYRSRFKLDLGRGSLFNPAPTAAAPPSPPSSSPFTAAGTRRQPTGASGGARYCALAALRAAAVALAWLAVVGLVGKFCPHLVHALPMGGGSGSRGSARRCRRRASAARSPREHRRDGAQRHPLARRRPQQDHPQRDGPNKQRREVGGTSCSPIDTTALAPGSTRPTAPALSNSARVGRKARVPRRRASTATRTAGPRRSARPRRAGAAWSRP